MKNSKTKILAALDIGTQTFRLAVVKVENGRLTTLETFRENVRLGEGLHASGSISDTAMDRGLVALKKIKKILDKYPVTCSRCCGTAVLREAKNKDLFLEEALKLAFKIEILDGKQEAEISFKGVASTLPPISGPVLLVDVGGGSTEFILSSNQKIVYNNSLNVGAVTLFEKHLKRDPPDTTELEMMNRQISSKIKKISGALKGNFDQIIGVGGTASSLASMALRLKEYHPQKIRGFSLGYNTIKDLWQKLVRISSDERRSCQGIDPERSDIIIAGIAIFQTILETLGHDKILISDGGLLMGLIKSLIEKEFKQDAQPPDTRCLYI